MKNNPKSIKHVYIHVPFCLQKCGYCSFYSEVFSQEKKQEYLLYLLREIDFFQNKFEIKPKTIYLGGGTPSLLSSKEINSILHKFNFSQIREITLEANPATITTNYANEIFQTPINRISLGIQSFDDSELKLLGRLHNSKQAEAAFINLRKGGFHNISFDLIYGLPNQTEKKLIYSLKKIIELEPEHISTYCLSLEIDVSLFPMKAQIPADEQVSNFYFLIREKLLAAGYQQYEISNFAKTGFASKHNLCYWDDKFYLGFGPAAAGYVCHPECFDKIEMYRRMNEQKRIRYTNPANLDGYYKQIERKQIFLNAAILKSETYEKEFIILALRKAEGLNLKMFQQNFKTDFLKKYNLIIEKYLKQNLLVVEGDFIKLMPKAYFVSNEILAEFI